MPTTTSKTKLGTVVSHAEWIAARKAFLEKEKELTHLRDELSRQRLQLPWERVEKNYVFDTPGGKQTLSDLFEGRSQLAIYHFMFGPGWKEGCPSCSYLADTFDGIGIHLAHRDTTFAAVSRATLPEIEAFKKRMGWRFKWVSSYENDFNFDYHVSFRPDERKQGKVYYNYGQNEFPADEGPGASAFFKDEAGEVFHTYSSFARGLDPMIATYQWLDIMPKGRDESGLAHPMAWVRHHDKYDDGYRVDANAQYRAPEQQADSCCSEKRISTILSALSS